MNDILNDIAAEPNKLHSTTFIKIHKQPLLGALLLETDKGPIILAVNRTVAEELLSEIERFLMASNEQ
ncbi:hypothetical protein [Phyllobacterium sp. SB3]|uniref:hypothetical protein n=1 Tax=Phyllobacterium sp. SB3 TaxID=3156073 RepID=UPI0032AFC8F6